jgi:hypothetical protein
MEEVDHDNPPIWETQLAYLKRHDLVLPGEESGSSTESFAQRH